MKTFKRLSILLCICFIFACKETNTSTENKAGNHRIDNQPQHSRTTRIVGGDQSASDDWPWMVALIDNNASVIDPFCGGSLVSPSWVVTAAHCVENESYSSFEIYYGDTDVNGENGRRVPVKQILIHPDYNSDLIDSDIAMIELSENLEDIPFISVLSDDTNIVGLDGIVMGWGRTGEYAQHSDVLLQVTVPIVSNETCSEAFDPGEITENMICAGDAVSKKDSCYGDSGGPLIVYTQGKWFLTGVVSWGEGCARPGNYGVYTRISQFYTFITHCIESNTWFADLTVTAPDQTQKKVSIGIDINASIQEAPPHPPGTLLNFWIEHPETETSLIQKTYAVNTDIMYTWVVGILYDSPILSSPVQLSWSIEDLSATGLYVLLNGIQIDGPVMIEDMRTTTLINIDNANSVKYITICWIPEPMIEIPLHQGWNLVSSPYEHVFDSNCCLGRNAYFFRDGYYYLLTSMMYGQGFWLFSEDDSVLSISGIPDQDLSMELSQGWHLLGSIHTSSTVVSSPNGCIDTIMNWNGTNYNISETIEPGSGYWIKINSPCHIQLIASDDSFHERLEL